MARTFSVSKYLNKVTKIIAPISEINEYSVSISTQNFYSCDEWCQSIDIIVYKHGDEKPIEKFSTTFTSYIPEENTPHLKELKKFVNDTVLAYTPQENN